MKIGASELIITADGAVYHLNVRPDELAENIIFVGDPDRVPMVSKYFDKILFKKQHREFITHTGRIGANYVSVISTGIGTDNIDIVMNEIDALANIDFKKREVKKEFTQLNITRIGTAGGLQKQVEVDSFVVSEAAVGLDGLLHYYANNLKKPPFINTLQKQLQLPYKPYYAAGSKTLLDKYGKPFHKGITATCNGFYGPQGRILRLQPAIANLPDQLSSFKDANTVFLNFEMETAGIYGLAELLGHQACSISLIVANRITQKFSKNAAKGLDSIIKSVLDRY